MRDYLFFLAETKYNLYNNQSSYVGVVVKLFRKVPSF